MKEEQVGMFIGKFAPFHKGHLHIVKEALKTLDRVVIVVGSNQEECTIRIPMQLSNRISAITESCTGLNVSVVTIQDYQSDTYWFKNIRDIIAKYGVTNIVGYNKDDSSYYLGLFPELASSVVTEPYKLPWANQPLNATDVREIMYALNFTTTQKIAALHNRLPEPSIVVVLDIMKTFWFENLAKQYNKIKLEKDKFKDYPYPSCLNICCADAVVIDKDAYKVLLVTRKDNGKLANAGGHLENTETFLDCAVRELQE